MEATSTTANTSLDYNRFYNGAYDVTWVSNTCPRTGGFHQDFWQCQGIGCSTGGDGCTAGKCSPIILDISGKGFALTSTQDGVMFNFSGSGPIKTAWTAKGSDNAFLCLPDINGKCDDGADLFGNFTPQPASDHPNGFAALAVYDDRKNGGNGDGVIDSRDAVFKSLRLWIDANHDGISQPDELRTLPSLGVNSLSLRYKESDKTDQYGNEFRYRALVNPDDSDAEKVGRKAYDVFLVAGQPTALNLTKPTPARRCAVRSANKGDMLWTGTTR